MIVEMLGSAGELLEDMLYITLFLGFMLFSHSPQVLRGTSARADAAIRTYIRGKAAVGLIIASCDAAIFYALGIVPWLAFGLLAFWLSFIPNLGMIVSIVRLPPIEHGTCAQPGSAGDQNRTCAPRHRRPCHLRS